MDTGDPKYGQYALVREMMDTVNIVKRFEPAQTQGLANDISTVGRLFLTGEGSSRIFPAKNTIRKAFEWGLDIHIATDGARQAASYELQRFVVLCTSNSGRTKEVVNLANALAMKGHNWLYGLTANQETPLHQWCKKTYLLNCGWEQSVAATKSVVEQALFY